MKLYFSLTILALLSSILPLMAEEGESDWQRIAKARASKPGGGQALVSKVDAEREAQRKVTAAKKAQDELQNKINNWASKLRIERFSLGEQKKLKEILPTTIADFEEEQKLTRGTEDNMCNRLSKLPFATLMNELQNKKKNKVLIRQAQKKLELEKEKEKEKEHSLSPQYHYDRQNFVFLSDNKDSYYNRPNFIDEKQNYASNKTELDKIYKILNIEKNGSIDKRHPTGAAKARKDFLNLVSKQAGVMFFPAAKEGKVNALLKVLRGPSQKVDYLFYNQHNLPGGLVRDTRYTTLELKHTFVALTKKNLAFAIPNNGPEGTILSLSTLQILNGADMKEVYALADSLWKNKTSSQPKAPAVQTLRKATTTQPKTLVKKDPKAVQSVQRNKASPAIRATTTPPKASTVQTLRKAATTQPKVPAAHPKTLVKKDQKAVQSAQRKKASPAVRATTTQPKASTAQTLGKAATTQPKVPAAHPKTLVKKDQKVVQSAQRKKASPAARATTTPPKASTAQTLRKAVTTQPKVPAAHPKTLVKKDQKAVQSAQRKKASPAVPRKKATYVRSSKAKIVQRRKMKNLRSSKAKVGQGKKAKTLRSSKAKVGQRKQAKTLRSSKAKVRQRKHT